MTRQIIKTAEAPLPAAPISQAVRSGAFVFVSGITPFDLDLKLVKDDFEAQMRQTMNNLGAILRASESGFDRVLKCTVILARREDWRRMNEIYGEYWKDQQFLRGLPSRHCYLILISLLKWNAWRRPVKSSFCPW
jgi:2-iminobutanoate/2-iminopropanoate deaminase